MNSYMKHERPCGDAGSATVLEAIQFTVSILTRFVLRTWSGLPPCGTLEPHRRLVPLPNRPMRHRGERERGRKKARSSFPLAPVDWLECDSCSVLRELRAVSLPHGNRKISSRGAKRTPVCVKYLDPTWGTYYSALRTWALENAAKICNHFRLHRCCPL